MMKVLLPAGIGKDYVISHFVFVFSQMIIDFFKSYFACIYIIYLTLLSLHTITVLRMYYRVVHLSTMMSHTNVKGIHTLL